MVTLYNLFTSTHFLISELTEPKKSNQFPSKSGEEALKGGLKGLGLGTLLGLIETAGLVEALTGDDKLTVFAPTDAALKRFIDGLPSEPGKVKSGEASFTVMT